jgi:hypothetical protein
MRKASKNLPGLPALPGEKSLALCRTRARARFTGKLGNTGKR